LINLNNLVSLDMLPAPNENYQLYNKKRSREEEEEDSVGVFPQKKRSTPEGEVSSVDTIMLSA
jgi:hypothetical protein